MGVRMPKMNGTLSRRIADSELHQLSANTDAERSILGAILLDNHAYAQTEILLPDDFSLDSHRRIYGGMRDLAQSLRPIDLITLVEELDRRNELEMIGDVGYISGLVDGFPPVRASSIMSKLCRTTRPGVDSPGTRRTRKD